MRDSLKIALGIVLGVLTLCVIAACCYSVFALGLFYSINLPTPQSYTPPTQMLAANTPVDTPTPKQVSLPYSVDEDGLRITVLEVVPSTQVHVIVPEGYRQWTLNFKYQNLLNTDWEAPDKPGLGQCAELVREFRLETNQGNIYKPTYSGGELLCDSLKPKETLVKKELYIFEIRNEEKPARLLGYDEQQQLLYIFVPSQ
jgi:hypothetical protein